MQRWVLSVYTSESPDCQPPTSRLCLARAHCDKGAWWACSQVGPERGWHWPEDTACQGPILVSGCWILRPRFRLGSITNVEMVSALQR